MERLPFYNSISNSNKQSSGSSSKQSSNIIVPTETTIPSSISSSLLCRKESLPEIIFDDTTPPITRKYSNDMSLHAVSSEPNLHPFFTNDNSYSNSKGVGGALPQPRMDSIADSVNSTSLPITRYEAPSSPYSSYRLQPLQDDRPLPSLNSSSSSTVSDTPLNNGSSSSVQRMRSSSSVGIINSTAANTSIGRATIKRIPSTQTSAQSISFIHLLPDPCCLVNKHGTISQLNSAFEKIFHTVLPTSTTTTTSTIYDIIDSSLVESIKTSISQGINSPSPYIRQYTTNNTSSSLLDETTDTYVWTVSSLGGTGSSGGNAMTENYFMIMYSRPRIESVLSDLSPKTIHSSSRHGSHSSSRHGSIGSHLELPQPLLRHLDGIPDDENILTLSNLRCSADLAYAITSSESMVQQTASKIKNMESNSSQTTIESSGSMSSGSSSGSNNKTSSILLPETSTLGSDRFSRRFAHELRTPLHIVLNSISCLEDNISSTANSSAELADIKSSAYEIKGIIDDYTFISGSVTNTTTSSTTTAGEVEAISPTATSVINPNLFISTLPIYLPKYVQDISQKATKNLLVDDPTIVFNFVNVDDSVYLTNHHLERILFHLFNNAAKYSPNKSKIMCDISTITTNILDTSSSSSSVTTNESPVDTAIYLFKITNTIQSNKFNINDVHTTLTSSFAATQEYISKKEKMNTSISYGGNLAYHHGLGFGLTVALNMVKSLGGTLECKQETPTTITFYFKLNLLKFSSSRLNSDESDLWCPGQVLPYQPTVAPAAQSSRRGSKIIRSLSKVAGSVLVVDDSKVCRKVMVSKLAEEGFVTEIATNGLEACEFIEAHPDTFDAILLDLHMPVMDGVQATKFIRSNLHSNIPILILSAEQSDIKNEAVRYGANGVVDKPATGADVIIKLRSLIADYKRQKLIVV